MRKTPEEVLRRIEEAKLKKLDKLNLSIKNLEYIPPEVFELTHLKELDLSSNNITTIPDSLAKLTNLASLNLCINQITTIPSSLAKLTNLTSLDLSGNQITTEPDSLTQLTNLTYLRLRGNRITTIPNFLVQLTNLTSLDLSMNRITTIPDFLAQLTNLTSLDLGENRITTIPSSILYLKKLERLSLYDNPIKDPPPEIVQKGVKAIKNYFHQKESEGIDHIYEAKLIIVGEAGAGKTTLAQKIKNPKYQLNENEKSTEGIDVSPWYFPMENGKNFRVNIWDFGGQEIYHATHQFFLTKRSLYALVADTRKEDTDFYYWLNVVELLSDNSPLLIIKNEKQDRHREINESQLRGQFDNLKDTLATNLATNRDLPKVLQEIKHHIQQLPHIGSPLPKTWIRVRETLEKDTRNHITLDEYLNICEQNGFKQLKDKLQLSGYLHDIGICLHFQDDLILENTVILKPKWGTDAVYKVLDNPNVLKNYGRFNKSDLTSIWNAPEYANIHDKLLQLMINFKLCYQIPNSSGQYIAPQLLSDNQPDYEWNKSENLILCYEYEFMPKGILTRFIVAMHKHIKDQRLVWKSGVILEKDGTQAEVIEYYNKREIRIRIVGMDTKALMAIVTHELDNINDSFKRLKCDKKIPCNCLKCKGSQDPHFYPLKVLRQFRQDRQFDIQCQKSYTMVNVLGLIDDVAYMQRESYVESAATKDLHIDSVGTFIYQGDHIIQQTALGNNTVHTKKGDNNMKDKPNPQIKSAWANGSFYLFAFLAVIAALGVLAKSVPTYALPLILIAGIIFVPVIGALQLRQDDKLREKAFLELMKLCVGQLPLIGNLTKRKK